MDIRVLRYFIAVVESGTVSAAASELRITQPALSRQLKILEKSTGVTLFHRIGNRFTLTAEGSEFLQVAREALHKFTEVEQTADRLAQGQVSTVSLAAPRTTLDDVVAPFVAAFSEADPIPSITEISIQPDLERVLPRFDLVVTTRKPPESVSHLPLARLGVWAYVPASHSWAGRSEVTIDDLVTEQLLLPSHDFEARVLLESALSLAGLSPRRLVETSHSSVAQALAAAGRGVAVLSDDPRFELVPIPVRHDGWDLTVQLFAAWRSKHHATQAMEQIAERMQRFCTERYGNTLLGRSVKR